MSMKFTVKLVFAGYLSFSTLTFASTLSPLDNAIAVLKAGQTEEAIALFEKHKEDPKAMVYLAKIYMDVDLDEAEEFTVAISKNAETEASITAKYRALYQLGKTSVLSETNIDAGIIALREYIDKAPDLDGLAPKPWAEFRLANLLALNTQKAEAKTIYLRLAKADNEELAKQAKKAAKKI